MHAEMTSSQPIFPCARPFRVPRPGPPLGPRLSSFLLVVAVRLASTSKSFGARRGQGVS